MSGLRLCYLLALGHCVLAAVVGCSTMQRLTPKDESERRAAHLQALQLKVMRYADDYTGRMRDALVSLDLQSTPPEVRLLAQNWRVGQATAAYTIASGPNPTINALDMIVLASLSRMVGEDQWQQNDGPVGQALLAAHRDLERQSWSLVEGLLDAQRTQQLHDLIERWRAENPTVRAVAQVRFADFSALELRRDDESHGGGSLFAFIGLDPLSNLDPAVRELEQTRQLAERTIYYLQRAPALLDMEIERLAYQLAAMPEIERALTGMDRLSSAAAGVGDLATRAPEIIASERQAIIADLSRALHTEQARLQPLLVNLRDVLNAGTQTAQSLTGTVAALDALAARMQPDEPKGAAASAPRRPFDITEYTTSVRELGTAAERMQSLLVQLDTSSQGVAQITRAATQDLQRVIDHAFWRALLLILVLGVVATLSALLYQYWSPRLQARIAVPRAG